MEDPRVGAEVQGSERMWGNLNSSPSYQQRGPQGQKPPKPSSPTEGSASGAGIRPVRSQPNSGFLSSLLYENSSHLFHSSSFVAFSPGLSLSAAPLLFQTALPSGGSHARWRFRKSLSQPLRASALETEQPSTPSVVSARESLAAICRFVLPTNCSSPGLLRHWGRKLDVVAREPLSLELQMIPGPTCLGLSNATVNYSD